MVAEQSPSASASIAAVLARIRGLVSETQHDHAVVHNINALHQDTLTTGQRIADLVARNMGSWRFIIIQSTILAAWVVLNVVAVVQRWDPYPFILLNLMLSFQAAYAAPIIMMSQNRQSDKDRLAAEHDYIVNIRSEAMVFAVLDHLQAQDDVILAITRQLQRVHKFEEDEEQRAAEARLEQTRKTEGDTVRLFAKREQAAASLAAHEPPTSEG